MTGFVYFMLALSFVARILSDFDEPGRRTKGIDGDDTVDGMPLLGIALLIIGWGACREDPLRALGLSVSLLVRCPWRHMFAVWAAAFVTNRAIQAYLFRVDLRCLVDSGMINPGGTYLALAGSGPVRAAVVGAAMTFSQTFIEEFFFRGLALLGVAGALKHFGVPAQAAVTAGVAASSLAFGLIHFIPIRQATRGKRTLLPWYALTAPSGLGATFCVLNAMAGSLWPGWLVHWWLNYAGFMWSRAGGRWERVAGSPGS